MTDPSQLSQELFGKVQSIIAKELDVPIEKVTPQARFVEDLGADSLDTVELLLCLEEALGVQIPSEEADKFKTVTDLLRYVEEKDSTAKGFL